MKLKIRDVYYIRYRRFHVDPFPALYVLWSDASDTYGLNIHYLPQIFSKKWRFKRFNWPQTIDQLRRYRKHPALHKFFQFIESEIFDKLNWHSKYNIIINKWPRFIKVSFRHYKTPFIQILTHIPKPQLSLIVNPEL